MTSDSNRTSEVTPSPSQAAQAGQQQRLTRAAYERLRTELAELSGPTKIKLTEQVAKARALGDLSENADYHAAREELGKVNGRIMQLERLLEEAEIVDAAASDRAEYGVVVSLRFDGADDDEKFLIGSIEERPDAHEVISPTSPLGQAVLGAKVGDVVRYEAPAGSVEVKLVSVSPLYDDTAPPDPPTNPS